MYAELFGIRNPTPGVEGAAKWLQWAQYGIMQGASKNDAAVRYNLDAFWKDKAGAYQFESAEGRRQLEHLDAWAHGLWGALESGKVFSAPPTFVSAVKNVATFGLANVERPGADTAVANIKALTTAQVRAAEASKSAAALAIAAQGQQYAATADARKSTADEWWKATGPMNIPVMVWALAGGVALVALVGMTKGKR